MQLTKLREKLKAIAKELEVANKETFLSSVATEQAAQLASSQLSKPSDAPKPKPSDTAHKAESHGKLKPKDRRLKKEMKPKIDELEEAEKRPKLFQPAAGPPPKVGEEELAAEGSGHEVLLQVWQHLGNLIQCSSQLLHQLSLCVSRMQHCDSLIWVFCCTSPECSH